MPHPKRTALLEALFDAIDMAPSEARTELLEALTDYRRTFFRSRPVPALAELYDTIAAACGDMELEYRKTDS